MFAEKAQKRLTLVNPYRVTAMVIACIPTMLLFIAVALMFSSRARVYTVQQALGVVGAAPAQDANGQTNILLLGVGDENHDGADLTDTMIIASIDPLHTQSAVLLSLPRDLFMDTNRRLASGRINAVYANEKYRLKRDGLSEEEASQQALRAVADEIGEKVGLTIHGVLKTDFTAFTNVVDALGGVDIEVAEKLTDYTYPLAEGRVGKFTIDAGLQHLDGETALRYARSRHSTSDFDRSARQQQLITAVATKVRAMGRLDQVGFLLSLNKHLAGHVETTMSTEELLGIAQIASELSMDHVITNQINFTAGSDYSQAAAGGFVFPPPREDFGGASILLPTSIPGHTNDWSQILTFTQFLTHFRDAYLADSNVMITNRGAKPVDAYRLRNELLRYDWQTYPIQSSPKTDTTKDTFVYYKDPDHFRTAEIIGSLLNAPVARASNDLTGSGDVLVMLGSSFAYKPFQTLSGSVLPTMNKR